MVCSGVMSHSLREKKGQEQASGGYLFGDRDGEGAVADAAPEIVFVWPLSLTSF